jgi:hypothetical protein
MVQHPGPRIVEGHRGVDDQHIGIGVGRQRGELHLAQPRANPLTQGLRASSATDHTIAAVLIKPR